MIGGIIGLAVLAGLVILLVKRNNELTKANKTIKALNTNVKNLEIVRYQLKDSEDNNDELIKENSKLIVDRLKLRNKVSSLENQLSVLTKTTEGAKEIKTEKPKRKYTRRKKADKSDK